MAARLPLVLAVVRVAAARRVPVLSMLAQPVVKAVQTPIVSRAAAVVVVQTGLVRAALAVRVPGLVLAELIMAAMAAMAALPGHRVLSAPQGPNMTAPMVAGVVEVVPVTTHKLVVLAGYMAGAAAAVRPAQEALAMAVLARMA